MSCQYARTLSLRLKVFILLQRIWMKLLIKSTIIDVPFAPSRLNLGTYYYRKRWSGDPIPKRGRYGDCVLFPSYSNVLKRPRPSLIALWERKCKVERASTFKRPSTCLNSLLSPGVEDALQRNCWLSFTATWESSRIMRFWGLRLLILA